MVNKIVLTDSVIIIQQTIEVASPLNTPSTLDLICKIATVSIALINIVLIVYIFLRNNNRDNKNNEKNRKIGLLKILILDYNMKYLYQFFIDILNETSKLKENELNYNIKEEVNNNLLSCGNELRQKFIDSFIAVDSTLYNNILHSIDELLDSITNSIFDEGINLAYAPKFNELIINKMTNTKTHIIKLLFSYSGE